MRINLRKMHDNQAGTIASVKVAGELGRRNWAGASATWDLFRGPKSRSRVAPRCMTLWP
jgi:hypothetical protein